MRISSDFSIPVIFIIRMLIPRHIRSGLRQSQHLSSPRTHGVFTPMLRALSGPATFRALWIADSKSGQTLFFARNYVQPFVSVQRGGGAVADVVYIDNLSGFAYRVRAADICFGDGCTAPRRSVVISFPVPDDFRADRRKLFVKPYAVGRGTTAYTDGGTGKLTGKTSLPPRLRRRSA